MHAPWPLGGHISASLAAKRPRVLVARRARRGACPPLLCCPLTLRPRGTDREHRVKVCVLAPRSALDITKKIGIPDDYADYHATRPKPIATISFRRWWQTRHNGLPRVS